jgi:hypothetical protein
MKQDAGALDGPVLRLRGGGVITEVRATRLYLAADAYDKKQTELARMLRRAWPRAVGQTREAFLLLAEVDALAAEIQNLEARVS